MKSCENMPILNLKPTHQVVQTYYQELHELTAAGKSHEGAVAPAFANLLRHCAKQVKLRLVEQETLKRGRSSIRPDGVLLDELNLRHGVWEAKDSQDSLEKEIQAKFQQGYPQDNILFQSPDRLVIYQGREKPVFDANIKDSSARLVEGLKLFFEYQKPEVAEWQQVTAEFQGKITELGKQLVKVIEHEYQTNKSFKDAFDKFTKLCQTAINPNLSRAAIEEMLIQHLLTERIFTTVFDNPEFVDKNVIAREINQVLKALTSQSFNQAEFIKQNQLARFYTALERTAATIDDYADKQPFLNAVYERFFQGFAVKVADTHGIVYTPQPIVEFMVNSVQEILQREFNRTLADHDVHIIDPFVGTGNFMIRLLKEIHTQNPFQLEHKYGQELHCNEVMLLPYYIASMNIEHQFYELTGKYIPFKGICLVDTFELVEERQKDFFVTENTQRVFKQKSTPIFVIIGNPPYNAGQQNENDNNKNRQYPVLDKLVTDSYAKDSKATLKMQLYDPYVKAFQWATWRLQESEEGIVAFVSNNSFLDNIAFDGMRKHLMANFSKIYHLNLKGNARTTGECRKQEAGNVFNDAIRVGVGITFLVKKKPPSKPPEVWIYSINDYLKSPQKQEFLARAGHLFEVPIQFAQVDRNYTWLTEGLQAEFETFIPLGTKTGKAVTGEDEGVIFKFYSGGVKTNRDAWAYHFNREVLAQQMRRTITAYNEHVFKWLARDEAAVTIDEFVTYDDTRLSWDGTLKKHLQAGKTAKFATDKIRGSLYRPFTKQFLFFDRMMNNSVYRFYQFFPIPATETENRVICCTNHSQIPFVVQITNGIPDLCVGGRNGQCFPFYTYAEDGSHRQENITDWALTTFRQHYRRRQLTKWDIFYYVYGLLHHPIYREQYAANLRRELPRLPLTNDFWVYSEAGQALANLHLNYETQPEYPLQKVAIPGAKLHYRVDKMRLTQEKDSLVYNDALTFKGIPPETFEYRLGNRSALEWVIDQYQVTTDKRSGIINDPNRGEDEQYIVRLVGQVITVSLETVKIVKRLPELELLD
jgi:predicted helicase